MIAAIHQPVYLPWQPYFGKIAQSDVFVFLDDVQYPGGKGFFNRNTVKGPQGPVMLTAPVKGRGDKPTVSEIVVDDGQPWQAKHWKTIQVNYAKAPFFSAYAPALEEIYLGRRWQKLCELNTALICKICELMELKTRFVFSSQLAIAQDDGLQRLIALVQAVGADTYLTGGGAGSMRYMDEDEYSRAGIKVLWHTYEQQPYRQLWGAYVPDLSILDLLFNRGPQSAQMLHDCSSNTGHAS